jgi:hypothetical protein
MSAALDVVTLCALMGILGCLIAERYRQFDARRRQSTGEYCRCSHRRWVSIATSGAQICHECIKHLPPQNRITRCLTVEASHLDPKDPGGKQDANDSRPKPRSDHKPQVIPLRPGNGEDNA